MSQALAQGLLALIPVQLAPLVGHFRLPGGAWPTKRSSGPHLSPAKGQSVEFFEHRDYSIGDDPRRIDWRASAKGERTMVRFGQQEQENPVYIFLDNHTGMAYGEQTPPERWAWARGVAALIAYSALKQNDPVALLMKPQALTPPSTRGQHIAQICEQLLAPPNAAHSQLGPSLRAWSKLRFSPGRIFFISDWLDLSERDNDHSASARELFRLMQELHDRGHRTWGLELLHRDELELRFKTRSDAINFVDPTNRRPSQVGDPNAMREPYLSALRHHRQALADWAKDASMHWCPMRSDQPWANALHHHLGAPIKGQ